MHLLCKSCRSAEANAAYL